MEGNVLVDEESPHDSEISPWETAYENENKQYYGRKFVEKNIEKGVNSMHSSFSKLPELKKGNISGKSMHIRRIEEEGEKENSGAEARERRAYFSPTKPKLIFIDHKICHNRTKSRPRLIKNKKKSKGQVKGGKYESSLRSLEKGKEDSVYLKRSCVEKA